MKIDKDLHRMGVAFHWLVPRSKRPIGNDWSNAKRATYKDLEDTYRKGNNVGVRLGPISDIDGYNLHAIDLDIRDKKYEKEAYVALNDLFEGYDVSEFPTVQSGSMGSSRHFYFMTDGDFGSRKLAHSEGGVGDDDGHKHWYWEIELFGKGKQVACPPSIHPDTRKPYKWIQEIDFEGPPIVESDFIAELLGIDEDIVYDNDILQFSVEEVESYVRDLDDTWAEDRDTWIKVGMALHHEFEGSDDGFDIWCDFARRSKKFSFSEHRFQWKSLKNKTGKPVTMKSVIEEVIAIRAERHTEDLIDTFGEDDEQVELDIKADADGQPPSPSKKQMLAMFDDDEVSEKVDHIDKDENDPWDHESCEGFPEICKNLGGLLGHLVDYSMANASTVQPLYFISAAFSIGSLLVSRNHAGVVRKGQPSFKDNYSTSYNMIIGPTGSGKEFPRNLITSFLQMAGLPHLKGANAFTSKSGIVHALETSPRRLMSPDEFGGYMKSHKDGSSTHQSQVTFVMLELYGLASSVIYDDARSMGSKTLKEKQENQVGRVYNPALSISGTTTPSTLYDALGGEDISSGLINRFTFFESNIEGEVSYFEDDLKQGIEFDQKFLDQAQKIAYPALDFTDYMNEEAKSIAIRMVDNPILPAEPKLIFWTDAAKFKSRKYIDIVIKLSSEGETQSNLYKRTIEKGMRFALVHAVCSGFKKIDVKSMAIGMELSIWCDQKMVECAMHRIDVGPESRMVDILVELIEKRNKPLRPSDMRKSRIEFKKFETVQDKIFRMLELREGIHKIEPKTGSKGMSFCNTQVYNRLVGSRGGSESDRSRRRER